MSRQQKLQKQLDNNLKQVKQVQTKKYLLKKTPRLLLQYSQTNNQQFNVDEADIVKIQDGWIYSISGNYLNTMKGYPVQDFQITLKIQFNDLNKPKDLFIQGDYLVVVLQKSYQTTLTLIYTYSIQNRATPSLISIYMLQGTYFNGRKDKKTGFVYLVTQGLNTLQPPGYIGKQIVIFSQSQIYKFPDIFPNPSVYVSIFTFKPGSWNRSNMTAFSAHFIQLIYMSQHHSFYVVLKDIDFTHMIQIKVFEQSLQIIEPLTIQGIIHHQSAIDEQQGLLKVAVTKFFPSGQTNINVYVLRKDRTANILYEIQEYQQIVSTMYSEKRLYIGTKTGFFLPLHLIKLLLQHIQQQTSMVFLNTYKNSIKILF